MNSSNDNIIVSQRKLWVEILYTFLTIFIFSGILFLVEYVLNINGDINNVITFTYSEGKNITIYKDVLLFTLSLGAFVTLFYMIIYFLVKPSDIDVDVRFSQVLMMFILDLFGYLAFIVITIFVNQYLEYAYSATIACFLVGIYTYLIYKMYIENRTYSNKLFWEIFRFVIVGLIAAIFDFTTCMAVQFIAFKDITAVYVTLVSTACGFIIGVIINYLMSTYMVYKASKSNLSKTFKGMVLFFVLSAIGLGIGMGLQYLLYDCLYSSMKISFLTYPVDFVIRTLVVMVYNYITRKVFLYK